MSECVLTCLTLFMPCLTTFAFRSMWKHISCYGKMSPGKSQLEKFIISIWLKYTWIVDSKF